MDGELTSLLSDHPVKALEGDLRDPHALTAVTGSYDAVFHLAAIVGVARVQSRPYDVLRDNWEIAKNVIEWLRASAQIGRLLFASTSEVYAGALENFTLPIPTPEETALALPSLERPRTAYLLSKLYGEAACHYSGLPYTIVRPHNVYGPRMGLSHVIPELLERAHVSSDPGQIEVASPDHMRTFCYVDDAVEMILSAAESPRCVGETLNIGSEAPEISMRELANLVSTVVDKDLTVVPLPDTPGSPARRCPNMDKTRTLLGYEPRFDLATGVRSTYDWYVENVFGRRGVANPEGLYKSAGTR